MPQKSIFWTTGLAGDGLAAYTEGEVFAWLKRTFLEDPTTQGVHLNHGDELIVSGVASPVLVGDGAAIVNGIPYENDTQAITASKLSVAIPTPTTGPTGHKIVLRADYTANTVRVALLSSADGVGGYPGVTQNASVWEITLAFVSITTGGVITVTDGRSFIRANVRGSREGHTFFLQAVSGYNGTDFAPAVSFEHGVQMISNKEVFGYANFVCPPEFLNSLVVTPVFLGAAGGNVRLSADYYYGAAGEAYNTHTGAAVETTVTLVTGIRTAFASTALTSAAAGDYVLCAARRDGPDILDTLADDIFLLGFIVSYIAGY